MTEDTLQASEELELPVEESESATEINEEEPQGENLEAEGKPEQAKQPEEEQSDPDWYVKAINRQHKKYRDAEREAQEYRQRLEALQQQLPQNTRPEVPPAPDPFDEDYEKKIQQRDDAIRKAAEWDARQSAQLQWQQQQEQQAAQERANQLRQTLTTYTQRATELGIKSEELQQAGNIVATMGVHDDVANFILADEKGPLITTYLAKHPGELEAMYGMTPVQAAVHIATKVKTKAESSHGITQAPPPPESLEGGGSPPRHRGPKGATFE